MVSLWVFENKIFYKLCGSGSSKILTPAAASAWMRHAMVHKALKKQGLSTSGLKQLPFSKMFGICQSNIVFL